MPKLAVICGLCGEKVIVEGGHKAFNHCHLRQLIIKANIATVGVDMKKQKGEVKVRLGKVAEAKGEGETEKEEKILLRLEE